MREETQQPLFFARYPNKKLNLGCGTDIREGYTNIDMHDYGRPDTMVGDVTDLRGLPSDSFEEIVAQDIIEHIEFRRTPELLFEWNRLLQVDGRLYIRTTFLSGLIRLMEKPSRQSIEQQLILLTNLFSRQLVPGDYHFTAFTEPLMRFYMWAAAFEIESVSVRDEWIFELWVVKRGVPYDAALLAPDLTDRTFLEQAYRCILGRAIDPPGLDTYLQQLGQGLPRLDVIRSIWTSPERQGQLVKASPSFNLTFFQGSDSLFTQ